MELPIEAVYHIHEQFVKRFNVNDVIDSVDFWDELLLTFMPKQSRVSNLREFRGLALMEVMSEWYLSCS